MKVKSSNYLKSVKPLLKKLLDRVLEEYSYASILAEDAKGKIYKVSKRGIAISENPIITSRGFVLKIYDDKGKGRTYAEYSFNEISEDSIDSILDNIKNILIPLKDVIPEGVEESDYDVLADEKKFLCESTEYEVALDSLSDEEIIKRLTDIHNEGFSRDERILDFSVNYQFGLISKLFISKNRDLEQNIMWNVGMVVCAAARGSEIKHSIKGFSKLGGIELLDEISTGIDEAVKTTIELLDSEPIVPGEYECICSPGVTGLIVHEAFGHGVEMDMFVKDRALAEQYIGEYVASPLVTMHDGASAANETATYFFDDEGADATDTVIIDKGILKRGINDSQTAMIMKDITTGNGRRESYKRKAYTRMTNTFFTAGNDKVEDMIASIKYGFLLENPSSGMEDPKNWGIQCMVNVAREIKDGKLTGKIFSPIVLTGYVPDLLKSISMVSDEISLCGDSFCGKGYKEFVKVSDGGPYIKAKVCLG